MSPVAGPGESCLLLNGTAQSILKTSKIFSSTSLKVFAVRILAQSRENDSCSVASSTTHFTAPDSVISYSYSYQYLDMFCILHIKYLMKYLVWQSFKMAQSINSIHLFIPTCPDVLFAAAKFLHEFEYFQVIPTTLWTGLCILCCLTGCCWSEGKFCVCFFFFFLWGMSCRYKALGHGFLFFFRRVSILLMDYFVIIYVNFGRSCIWVKTEAVVG